MQLMSFPRSLSSRRRGAGIHGFLDQCSSQTGKPYTDAACGGPGARHLATYPRSADEDGLESGSGRVLPANSRASPSCMGSPRGGSMNDAPTVHGSRDGGGMYRRRRNVAGPRPLCSRSRRRRLRRGGRRTPAGAGRRCGISSGGERHLVGMRVPQRTEPAIGIPATRIDGLAAPPIAFGTKAATGCASR